MRLKKLIGYWQSLQAALPHLRRDGSVIMLSGAASRTAMPGTAGLAAVNGAITQMAQTLAKELAPLRGNVDITRLVDTPAYDALPAEAKAGMFAALPVAAGRPHWNIRRRGRGDRLPGQQWLYHRCAARRRWRRAHGRLTDNKRDADERADIFAHPEPEL